MTLEIWLGSTLGYLLIGFLTMRSAYKAWRPYKVPVSCAKDHGYQMTLQSRGGPHTPACYRQPGGVDTEWEARLAAFSMGIFWPLMMGIFAVMGLLDVTFRSRELPEEKAWRKAEERRLDGEKTRALENENANLRRAQEGA